MPKVCAGYLPVPSSPSTYVITLDWLRKQQKNTSSTPQRPQEIPGQQCAGSRPSPDAQQKLRGRDRTQRQQPEPGYHFGEVHQIWFSVCLVSLLIQGRRFYRAKVLGVRVTNPAARLRSEE